MNLREYLKELKEIEEHYQNVGITSDQLFHLRIRSWRGGRRWIGDLARREDSICGRQRRSLGLREKGSGLICGWRPTGRLPELILSSKANGGYRNEIPV